MRSLLLLGLLLLTSCNSFTKKRVEHLAIGRVASDFDTYSIHRVGLMPVIGRGVDMEHAQILQSAFYTELSQQTSFEVVPLGPMDLEEINQTESYIRGSYEPEMIIEVAKRFRFDAMLVGTIVDYQFYSPQRLSVEMELVATETGAAIWSGSVQLDSTSRRVQDALEAFYADSGAVESADGSGWEIALLSPRLFAQFAAWQIAKLL
ncbi:MAG: hypothetical protein ACI9F9_001280 [Candidatus Paceibacteria bacterium]